MSDRTADFMCCGRSSATRLLRIFSSRRRHTRFDCDWSSDVCSSDLAEVRALSDEALKERYAELRKQVQDQLKDADPEDKSYKEKLQATLDPAIVPAFALTRDRKSVV